MANNSCPHCGGTIERTAKSCPRCGRELSGVALLAADARPKIQQGSGKLAQGAGIFALLLAIAGALTLSEATTGVGLLCGACLLGILARLAQASTHHRQLLRALEQRDTTVV